MNNELHSLVKNSYPFPIAQIYRKYQQITADRLNEKHALLGDVFEVLLKFVSIVVLKEIVEKGPRFNEIFPKGLDFLKHPSAGHWTYVLREITTKASDTDLFWIQKVSEWYKGSKPDKTVLDQYQFLPEISFPKQSSCVAGIIESLVTYRNKIWKGHGASIQAEDTIEKRISALECLIDTLLNKARFLGEMNLFLVKEVIKLDEKRFAANAISLIGCDKAARRYIYDNFNPFEIYLANSDNEVLLHKPLAISPLVEWQKNSNNEESFYFFNDAKRAKLEYLSYYNGEFYYHREIKQELEKLLDINLKVSSSEYEEKLYKYSEEERKKRSYEFFCKGLEFKQKEQYEGAIIAFESAIEWFRDPDYILELCETMILDHEDNEYIVNQLNAIFEIEPNNEKALSLKNQLEKAAETHSAISEEDKLIKQEVETLNLYDLLNPFPHKVPTALLASGLISGVYLFFCAMLFVLNQDSIIRNATPLLVQMCLAIIVCFAITRAKKYYLDAYASYARQIKNMKIEKFKSFFDEQYSRIFGSFLSSSSSSDNRIFKTKLNTKNEKFFLLFSLAFVISFGLGTFGTQSLLKLPPGIAAIKLLSTTLYWILMLPAIKYLIGSTLFIKNYSEKELSPAISRTTSMGYDNMVMQFFKNIDLLLFFYTMNWFWNYLAVNDPLYTDFLGLLFTFLIVFFWLIYTPKYIKRAKLLSRSSVYLDFGAHIRYSFEAFIKEPNQPNYDHFLWLLGKETELNKLPLRLFSFFQWLKYSFTILLILGVTVLYILLRLKIITIPFSL